MYREYPKVLTTPNGHVVVRSIAEEHAVRVTALVASDTAEAHKPIKALPAAEAGHISRVVAGQPGAPVITVQDQAEWEAQRRQSVLRLQRERRHRLRRIDYYPSEDAAAIIDKLRTPGVGHDASSIINRVLFE